MDRPYTVRTLAEHAELEPHFNRFHALAWPRFLHEGNGTGGLWRRLFSDFRDFQFGLWDEAGALVAVGNSIPFICDGSRADLPPDVPEILGRGVAVKRDGRRPTALSALAAIVDPQHRAKGLSQRIIETMRDIARRHELGTLVAPVRPILKHLYPLTPMERYVTWRRSDGAAFDHWLRVHESMGAETDAGRSHRDGHHGHRGQMGGVDGAALSGKRDVHRRGRLPAGEDRRAT